MPSMGGALIQLMPDRRLDGDQFRGNRSSVDAAPQLTHRLPAYQNPIDAATEWFLSGTIARIESPLYSSQLRTGSMQSLAWGQKNAIA
jgi:hypothetical protein